MRWVSAVDLLCAHARSTPGSSAAFASTTWETPVSFDSLGLLKFVKAMGHRAY